MDRLKPPKPPPNSLEGNILRNWKTWKQNFTLLMAATEYNGKSDEVKINLLLHCIGEKARKVYNTFVFSSTEDSVKHNKVLEYFEAYFGRRKNITLVLNFSHIDRNQAKHLTTTSLKLRN